MSEEQHLPTPHESPAAEAAKPKRQRGRIPLSPDGRLWLNLGRMTAKDAAAHEARFSKIVGFTRGVRAPRETE